MSVLSVSDLSVSFSDPKDPDTKIPIVKNIDLTIKPGEIVGLVGESGSGKSVTALSIMGLLDPRSAHIDGSIRLQGDELLGHGPGTSRALRGSRVSMVFQEPMTALDPVFTVGSQLTETLRAHTRVSAKEAKRKSIEMLDSVGIVDPEARFYSYPHELSGGMRQRVVIAIALLCGPELLIADEPTTAVDATVQLQLLDLIKNACEATGTSVLFITHDLGVVSHVCDRMATMYAGEIVETGEVSRVLSAPQHPYTAALLGALPRPETRGQKLTTIPGRVPIPGTEPEGCWFADRCAFVTDECRQSHPSLETGPAGTLTRCARIDEIAPALAATTGPRTDMQSAHTTGGH